MKSQTRVLRNVFMLFILMTAQYLPAVVMADEKPAGKH